MNDTIVIALTAGGLLFSAIAVVITAAAMWSLREYDAYENDARVREEIRSGRRKRPWYVHAARAINPDEIRYRIAERRDGVR